jgi:hypothetical protein
MPLLASYPISAVREIFGQHGIYAIEELPNGNIIWGDKPPSEAFYSGRFQIAGYYTEGRYDIFTIRSILSKLDKAGSQQAIEEYLLEHMHDDLKDDEDAER